MFFLHMILRNRIDLPLLSRNVVGDLSSVGSVVHEEQLDVFFITNEELLESVGQQVAGLSVC